MQINFICKCKYKKIYYANKFSHHFGNIHKVIYIRFEQIVFTKKIQKIKKKNRENDHSIKIQYYRIFFLVQQKKISLNIRTYFSSRLQRFLAHTRRGFHIY